MHNFLFCGEKRLCNLRLFAHIVSMGVSYGSRVGESVSYKRKHPMQVKCVAFCSLLLLMSFQDTGTVSCLLKDLSWQLLRSVLLCTLGNLHTPSVAHVHIPPYPTQTDRCLKCKE